MNAVSKDQLPKHERLKISEIFHSLQGEALATGLPTVFVRLTGCPLRCQYCDTAYAFYGGAWMSFDEIVEQVSGYATTQVCVTGGEPLAQKNCTALLRRLCDAGYRVSLETSGAYPIDDVDTRVSRVVDLKTPASGEQQRNRIDNLAHLLPHDQVKFVICDRNDYEWACRMVRQHQLTQRCEVLFSASHEQLPPRQLADWILGDRIPVRFQIQLHKYLWGNQPGH